MIDPGQITTGQATAAISRQSALDRLRSLLGPAFAGSPVTTDYGAPAWGTGRPHTGLDLPAAEGTPIEEPIGGNVERYFTDNSGGHQLVIRTPQGYREVFAHLSSVPAFLAITPNAEVPAGTVIGYVGQTGMASGSHLHYEVVKPGGDIGTMFGTLDPLAFISEFGGPNDPSQRRGERNPPTTIPTAANNWLIGSSRVKQIQDELNVLAQQVALGFTSPSDAAARLKKNYPDVPVSTLQEIAYGRSKDVAKGFGDPLSNIADSVNRLTGDLTDPHTWARLGLTFASAAVIILGVVLYVSSAAPKPRIP